MATTSTTYQFSATVQSPESQSTTDSQPFTVTSSSGGTSTAIFGATLTGASNLEQSIKNWENLVEPIGCQKIYFQKGDNPPPTTVAGSSNHIQVAAALGIPVILCFEPTVQGTSSDPGPATLSASAVGSGGTFTAGTYYWKITAVTSSGEGTPSNEVSATLVLNGSAHLTWPSVPTGTTGVNVYRGTSTGNENVLVASLGAVTSYTDTGIAGTSKSPPANWPGGADKPAQGTFATGHTGTIQGDLFDAIATVNGLSASGQTNPLNVLGVCIWQEADNDHNYIPNGGTAIASVDQWTYLYYQWYQTFKSHCPSVLLGCIITGYNNPYATTSQATTWIPGPTTLRPNDSQYTDFFMVDIYATGYHNFKYTPYQNGPGNAPNTGQAGNLWDIADYMNANGPFPCAAGWSEAGNSAGGIDPGQQYMTAYISSDASLTPYPGDPNNSMQAHYAYRVSNDLPCMPWMWYTAENAAGTASTGPNGIFNTGDYRIPLLQGLYKTMSGS